MNDILRFLPIKQASAGVPLLLVGIVLLMILPVPALLLDVLLATSIALTVALLLLSIHLEKPLDLSSFPTILLFGTLLRLALNVASTRLILLHGSNGPGAAGDVIRAFGEFMVGGNYVVGGTVFILLIIINFVVITKGAGRVAEVSARFTLDALPGKQMSIDADLAAGALTQDQARARRKEVEQESDFFGAMDGASKFVRGDAIAGLLMTGINVVVGIIIGVVQDGMPVGEAASTYTLLSIGDGLAAQIPALLMSTAAGVVVTRASAGGALPATLVNQLGRSTSALYATSGLLAVVGLMPGMPILPFFGLAGVVGWAAREAQKSAVQKEIDNAPAPLPVQSEREKIVESLPIERLELEIGYELLPLVEAPGGVLVERIGAIRKNLALELGVLVPSIQIRDNLRVKPGAYRLLLAGNTVGGGEVRIGRFLAMDPTGTLPELSGEQVREPAFGLPARWISAADRDRAEMLGYTVVDPGTVAATHLTELLRSIANELIGRTDVEELVEIVSKKEPRLVDDLIPNVLTMAEVTQVLRFLLIEGVSIRDLRSILECLGEHGKAIKDPEKLCELVRERLARHITGRFRDDEGRLAALVLDPRIEDAVRKGLDTSTAHRLLGSLDEASRAFAGTSTPPALVCAPDVRRAVSQFLLRRIPGLSVLSYREIDSRTTLRSLGVVS